MLLFKLVEEEYEAAVPLGNTRSPAAFLAEHYPPQDIGQVSNWLDE